MNIKIYTDGGARPNPGMGGWAAILMTDGLQHLKVLGGRVEGVTNNQMDVRAAIEGLTAIKAADASITIYTDSQYLANGTVWMQGWKARKWRTSTGKPVKNVADWLALDALLIAFQRVDIVTVKGHRGIFWNEAADKVATHFIKNGKEITADDLRKEWERWETLQKKLGNL